MFAPGDLLQNRYRIMHPLGKGGFGQVFEVEENGARKVLKVLNLSAFQPSQYQKAIKLFQREVEVLSQFCHPGVPQIEPDGYFVLQQDRQPPLHCLVMEKISGINLQQWQKKGGILSQIQAIDWLKQLITILAYLHRQQFFHRDIKPANIMLRPNGQLVLIDFGAVREMTLTYLVKQQQQETGTAIISAGYTPPEQADGQSVPQSDFFALGRTFVYLFTNQDPIDLPKDPQTGRLCWRDRVQSISPLLADLIDDLMAPFPGQRPQSCEVILKTIQTIERQILIQRWIPFVVWLTRLRLKKDKRGWFSRWLGTIGLGLVFSVGAVSWTNRTQISDNINDQGLNAYEAKNYETAWWFYQLALIFDPHSPIANFNLGMLYEDRQQLDWARAAYQTALKGDQSAQDRWKSLNNLARLYLRDKQYELAMPLLQEGLQLVEQPKDQYVLRKNLGWAYLGLKQYEAAETQLQVAIELNPTQPAAHCLMVPVLQAKVNNSDALAALNLCSKYADFSDPDYVVLSNSARSAFPATEVQP